MKITIEEVITAANTLKQYCQEHQLPNVVTCDDTCPIAKACLYNYDIIEEVMGVIVSCAREYQQNMEKGEEG